MKRPKIKITIIDRIGKCGCHRGHKVGDTFDFDTERGKLCPMAMHVAFPYIDILRYGGSIPNQKDGEAVFCCPDVDTINVFKIEVVDGQAEVEQGHAVGARRLRDKIGIGQNIARSAQQAKNILRDIFKELFCQIHTLFPFFLFLHTSGNCSISAAASQPQNPPITV